uniref:CAP-Gly domain-containing protein n=1 Tax=Tetranychus urticae TaxID=32264 RepID=T1L483_TETUR
MSPTKPVPVSTEILNPDPDDLTVGDCIYVNGTKSGIIKFLGSTSFAPGKWAGVELADASGKNDGSVNGVKYFTCEPKHPSVHYPSTSFNSRAITPPEKPSSTVTTTLASSRTTSSSASNLKVGDKVMVHASSGLKRGLASSINDGSVAGKRYFQCRPDHGLFAFSIKFLEICMVRRSNNLTTSKRSGMGDSRESSDKREDQISHLLKEEDMESEMVIKMEMRDEIAKSIDTQSSAYEEDDNEIELFQLQEEIIKKDDKYLSEQRETHYLETIYELDLKLKKNQDEMDKMEEDSNRMNVESKKLQDKMNEFLKQPGTIAIRLFDNQTTPKGHFRIAQLFNA